MEETVELRFDRGTILVSGSVRVPGSVWDDRAGAFRLPALNYGDAKEYLSSSSIEYTDRAAKFTLLPGLTSHIALRPYQQDALKKWVAAERKGVVVLPTGAGKTEVAIKAIETVRSSTLVVVPTIDLLNQWRDRLSAAFRMEVGALGGGFYDVRPLTVSTYDTAYLKAPEIGNLFAFLVFDEVHHLPAQSFRSIAEMFLSPFRLGLTATLEREDMEHRQVPKLVGGVVYRLGPERLAGSYLSEYTIQKVYTTLTPEEKKEYEANYMVFRRYVATHRLKMRGPADFRKLVIRSGRDPEARRALLARNRAMAVAFGSRSKIYALEKILSENRDERTIIFTQHNDLVYEISRRFLAPFITHSSNKEERAETLSKFRSGEYRILVTSKVLDEGIDVPEASLGIIVSGTGSGREYIQRLGRILRKREGKDKATLIELVSQGTAEANTSARRGRALS
ncbi:MAG: DEAD/DEAH box helicase family protein [Thermoprotei archaeon]